jgi:hypothetical protein
MSGCGYIDGCAVQDMVQEADQPVGREIGSKDPFGLAAMD